MREVLLESDGDVSSDIYIYGAKCFEISLLGAEEAVMDGCVGVTFAGEVSPTHCCATSPLPPE